MQHRKLAGVGAGCLGRELWHPAGCSECGAITGMPDSALTTTLTIAIISIPAQNREIHGMFLRPGDFDAKLFRQPLPNLLGESVMYAPRSLLRRVEHRNWSWRGHC